MPSRRITHAVWAALALLAAAACTAGDPPSSPGVGNRTDVPTGVVSEALRCTPGLDICPSGQKCQLGSCVSNCTTGFSSCPVNEPTYCAPLAVDANNCGSCGIKCPLGQQCSGGKCSCPPRTPDACGAGTDAFCTNRQSDPQNCGACGRVCGPGTMCQAGACVETCAPTFAACPATEPTYCALLVKDANNCGACGVACSDGQQCENGSCACPEATPVHCSSSDGDFCTDTDTDLANCGACDNVCPAGTRCESGTCVASCQPGMTICGGSCHDLQSDTANCGVCGRACASGKACLNGSCVTTACGLGGSCPTGSSCCAGLCVALTAQGCNDGNSVNGDGCSTICRVETGWSCSGTPSVCTVPCGDRVTLGSEECDDGNTRDGDGCSSLCRIESYWTCSGQTCTPICGDGVIVGLQNECEDGNTAQLDGCSNCTTEPGFYCTKTFPSSCGLLMFHVSPDDRDVNYAASTNGLLPPAEGSFPLVPTSPTTTIADACAPLPSGSLSGAVALIARGTCSFHLKALNAQKAGAIAVVVYDVNGPFINPSMSSFPGDEPVTIPLVMIRRAEGDALLSEWAAGTSLTMTWQPLPGT
jgi:cysteine-rich repeat protein